ncbi:copper chaperone PCu(A)C [Streptomyces sp. NPDC050703]|uniref:copper chaperone PCu(A)C n=1 Tax=Streptomyces sp. NPDC050703 TaxID=3157218 RepID=UPI003449F679
MSRSLRRGAIAATAIAFSLASLAACGAGNNAQTLGVKPDNAAVSVGDIKIQNAVVITQPDLKSKGPAVIAATVFNSGSSDQTLESITVDGTGKKAEITPAKGDDAKAEAKGPLTIPAGESVVIGGKGNASAVLPSSRESVKDGNAQRVTFSFSETGDVRLKAFVVPAESYFTEWGPTEVPKAPENRPSTPADASGKPSDGESGEPAGEHGGQAEGEAGTDPSAPADGGQASEEAGTGTDTGTGTQH